MGDDLDAVSVRFPAVIALVRSDISPSLRVRLASCFGAFFRSPRPQFFFRIVPGRTVVGRTPQVARGTEAFLLALDSSRRRSAVAISRCELSSWRGACFAAMVTKAL